MASLSTVVFLSAYAAMAVAVIPKNYILKVAPKCGREAKDDATVEITTDLVIEAQAVCDGERTVNFTSTDGVNFILPVSYPSQGTQPCVFKKQLNVLAFNVNVHVAYGEKPGLLHMKEERFLVTCTFSPHGTENSQEQSIVEGLIAPPEFLDSMGPDSKSTVTLELVDVLGGSLEGKRIHLGKMVQLRGRTAAEDGEVGLRPVQCFAMEGDSKYAILRGGCGDGIIFPKDAGFTTNGTTTLSPYFEAFSIDFATVVQFKCMFITCKDNCDGSSCKSEARKRRDTLGALQASANTASGEKLIRSKIIKFAGVQAPEHIENRRR